MLTNVTLINLIEKKRKRKIKSSSGVTSLKNRAQIKWEKLNVTNNCTCYPSKNANTFSTVWAESLRRKARNLNVLWLCTLGNVPLIPGCGGGCMGSWCRPHAPPPAGGVGAGLGHATPRWLSTGLGQLRHPLRPILKEQLSLVLITWFNKSNVTQRYEHQLCPREAHTLMNVTGKGSLILT